MKIKFYDDSDYNYPIIDIWEDDYKKFRRILKDYKEEDDYNIEGFYSLLEENGIQFNEINTDIELYF